MESKDKLKETDIKNRTCYYFDNIMRAWDMDINIDFSGILLDEKLYKEKYENILIYNLSYKTSTGAKPLRGRYNEIDGSIKIHNENRYLLFFDRRCFDKICDRIKYLLSFFRIDSYNSLPIDKILTFHNVIILI